MEMRRSPQVRKETKAMTEDPKPKKRKRKRPTPEQREAIALKKKAEMKERFGSSLRALASSIRFMTRDARVTAAVDEMADAWEALKDEL